jgi:fluoroacetyl-CoA thioesterase
MSGAAEGAGFEERSGTSGIVRPMPKIDAQVPSLPSAVHAGLSASVSLTVTESDTAISLRSGDVPVLGTPRLVALCEEASCRALDGRLGPDRTSVASRLQFDHLVAVTVGSTVTAEATLEKVEGRRLNFTISVSLDADDRAALVAAGRLTRVVVHRPTFLARAGCGEAGTGPPPDAAGEAGG